MTAGMKSYFDKYSFKNTTLADFIGCCEEAASKIPGKETLDITGWSQSWLTKGGINEVTVDRWVTDELGVSSIFVKQSYP
jgi:aminopeptidase N